MRSGDVSATAAEGVGAPASAAGGSRGGVDGAEAISAQRRAPDDLSLPSQRTCYYQLCDMKTEAIKRLVHEARPYVTYVTHGTYGTYGTYGTHGTHGTYRHARHARCVRYVC